MGDKVGINSRREEYFLLDWWAHLIINIAKFQWLKDKRFQKLKPAKSHQPRDKWEGRGFSHSVTFYNNYFKKRLVNFLIYVTLCVPIVCYHFVIIKTPRAGENRVTGPRSEQSPSPPPPISTLFMTKFFYVHIIWKPGIH